MCAGSVSSVDLSYENSSQTLICTSSGGPATSVTWTLNGSPITVDSDVYEASQIITDTVSAVYQNRLTLVAKSASLSGTYACSVGNTRGESRASLTISGNCSCY